MINRRLIRIKVLQVLYAYSKKSEGISSSSVEKELLHSIEKFYDLYLLLLSMVVEMALLEVERIEMRQNKNIRSKDDMDPSTLFSQNKIISKIEINPNLIELIKERKLNWKLYRAPLKRIYNEFIKSELYIEFINSKESSFIADKKFLIKFYSEFLAENQGFIDFLEEENIYWNDDSSFAIMMVIKTIESIKPDRIKNKILPLFKNDDDKDFARKLLMTTIAKKGEYLDIIAKHAQNWDTERIAQMDLVILQMAITELFEFKSIPVKVTLNEFIEISKYYSTEKSKIFINGVLDNIIKQLEKEGSIVKTGRGLINS
jgi:N utilization substance protein B